jgi:antitoxin YefM
MPAGERSLTRSLPLGDDHRAPRTFATHDEVVITRAGHEPVVILSLDDYQSLKETAYLLRSPENARRLLASIARLESGEGTERELSE